MQTEGMLEGEGEVEAGEEELAVLPRHTKVIVTGNNRTKSVLVGLHGVVKKAVGLGGWHWLVLTNGVEVKLQRNALSVIEAPTGQEGETEEKEEEEGDRDIDIEFPFANAHNMEDFPKSMKQRVRPQKLEAQLSKAADSSQGIEPAVFRHMPERSTEAAGSPPSSNLPMVDLSKLDTAALKRYRRHYKLVDVGPNSSKEQLLRSVGRHFMSHQLDEVQAITGFMQAVKRLKTVSI
ncbi:hypothetical protein O6H91_05G010600 [Diphasiastrum complanatum]|uniref:Uncharacterized protein n=2 Tax=Diphasiastrum complanatum TaxID=34168 RepID=A0ACC2DKJ4_DIPCM|nr:hypothetical protein O6H91_05G008400 [Diphasiastrum complanatum]KAJ7554819.1 hypothetical protein O6H91_05G010600 [Diphasiastrum complanatum]